MKRAMTATQGTFRYSNPSTIHFGSGCVAAIDEVLDHCNATSAYIITTKSLVNSEALRYLRSMSGRLASAPLGTVSSHVPIAEIHDIAREVRRTGADAVIALGGGSAIDAAKLCGYAAASASVESSSLEEFKAILGTGSLTGLPTFCVPTTLAAAELYGGAGFTDELTGEKDGAFDPAMTPDAVFYDPKVSAETPSWLWLATGIRSLDHSIETLLSPRVDPVSEVLATSAVKDLFAALPLYREAPGAEDVRLQCLFGAWKSYILPLEAATGLSHTLGKAVGAKNSVPHGITSCVILPHVVRHYYQFPETRSVIDQLSGNLGLQPGAEDECALANALEKLVTDLGLPTRFSSQSLNEKSALEAAARAARQIGSPVAPLFAILSACLSDA